MTNGSRRRSSWKGLMPFLLWPPQRWPPARAAPSCDRGVGAFDAMLASDDELGVLDPIRFDTFADMQRAIAERNATRRPRVQSLASHEIPIFRYYTRLRDLVEARLL
jgi:hypothetical protein